MCQLKTFKILALSFSLIAVSCLSSVQADNTIHSPVQSIERCAHNNSKTRQIKPIKLADFEGDWVIGIESVGGVVGASAVGVSATFDGQVTFDRDGNGVVHFLEGAVYDGATTRFLDQSQFEMHILLINPLRGIGTIEIFDPTISETFLVNFVAIRSRNGKAIRLEGHESSTNPGNTPAVLSYTFERQIV